MSWPRLSGQQTLCGSDCIDGHEAAAQVAVLICHDISTRRGIFKSAQHFRTQGRYLSHENVDSKTCQGQCFKGVSAAVKGSCRWAANRCHMEILLFSSTWVARRVGQMNRLEPGMQKVRMGDGHPGKMPRRQRMEGRATWDGSAVGARRPPHVRRVESPRCEGRWFPFAKAPPAVAPDRSAQDRAAAPARHRSCKE